MATPKFFITHSWNDIEFARRLFKDLTAHGVDGWMDDTTVRGGQRLAEEINKGLEGCDVYLSVLSPAALESPWCWEEINAAIALTNRQGRAKHLTIIPIIADKCEIPAMLFSRLYFDFVGRYDDALAELLSKGFGIAVQTLPSRSIHPTPNETPDARPTVDAKPKPPPETISWSPKPVAKTEPAPMARATTPEELENLYLAALEAFHLEKWQAAVDGFEKVEASQPGYEDTSEKLGLARRALHEVELAALYDGAAKLIEESKWQEAIDQLETLLKIDSGYRDARARLTSAKNMLQASDLYMQASEAMVTKKWNDAVRLLESLLTLAPNYQDAATKLTEAKRWAQLPDLYRRALIAIDVRQWQDAITLLEQIQGIDANYRESKTLLARVHNSLLPVLYDRMSKAIEAKQLDDAWTVLEQIRRIDPNYRESIQWLALVQKRSLPVPRAFTNPKDGKEMCLVPAGEFVMGDNASDAPEHQVYLDAFYISRSPVTNAEYKKFVDVTKREPPSHWSDGKIPQGKENNPVVNVEWYDAVAYCKWVEVRLPTEAEWEKAASWDEVKKKKRVYP
jgi:tetratricopeptide (TPR) repeat protein